MTERGVVLCKQAGVDGPVRVDQKQFDLDQEKPAKERVWSEWTAKIPTPAAVAPVSPVSDVTLPNMLVMKEGNNKFIVVDEHGKPITDVEGIDPEGYKTQAAAGKAIEALTNA